MTKELSKNFELAIELAGIQPMPLDIIKQLDELRKGVPEDELPLFDQLYDSLQ
jgi:hypothetical protein